MNYTAACAKPATLAEVDALIEKLEAEVARLEAEIAAATETARPLLKSAIDSERDPIARARLCARLMAK